MTIRSILVHVSNNNKETSARIRIAAALARIHEAVLIGAAADQPPPPFTAEGVVIVPIAGELELKQVREELDDRQRRFRAAVPADLKTDWRSEIGIQNTFLIEEARSADLLVLGKRRQPGEFTALDPSSVILKAGRPVLAIPTGCDTLPAKHALVAWKDSREARRAVADAVPLLRHFDRVTVVAVSGDENGKNALVAVAAYLNRHGITAQTRILEAHGRRTGARLIEEAALDEVDLIVAGAYGHSRLGEWIFGGVTHILLENSETCCLFSH